MKHLTLHQIREITFGTARIEEHNGGFHFCRFTQEQEDMYRQRKTEFYLKSLATAGVFMEFYTDSTRLSLDVEESYGSTRDFFVFSIYVDGIRIGELSGNVPLDGTCSTYSGCFDLGTGMKRVKIYFPWSACSVITGFKLDKDSHIQPVKKDKLVLIYGDSITHGYDAMRPENTYAVLLADRLNVNAINKAIAGETFWPMLATAKDPVTPEFITVAYGCNDWGRHTWQQLQEDSFGFYRSLCKAYPHIPIFALAPIWRSDIDTKGREVPLTEVCRLFTRIAGELPQITVFDGMDYLPHDPDYFSDRWLHPTDEGFRHYMNGLWENLKTRLPV